MKSTIAGGDHQQIIVGGKLVPNYALVQGIFIGAVVAFTFVITFIGPEWVIMCSLQTLLIGMAYRKHGAQPERHRAAYQEGGGGDNVLLEGEEEEEGWPPEEEEDRKESGNGQSGNGVVWDGLYLFPCVFPSFVWSLCYTMQECSALDLELVNSEVSWLVGLKKKTAMGVIVCQSWQMVT
jgi:hypothetical protein